MSQNRINRKELLEKLLLNIGSAEAKNVRNFLGHLFKKISKKNLNLENTTLLIGYGGGKDSTWVVAFTRLAQLLCKQIHGKSFKIKITTMVHLGMPRQVLANIDSVYRKLEFYGDKSISTNIFSYGHKEKFSRNYKIPNRIKDLLRTDILLAGHRSHGNPRATFCSTCNIHMISAAISNIDKNTDFILTGDSLDELKVYGKWLEDIFRKFYSKNNSKQNEELTLMEKFYNFNRYFFAELLPKTDNSFKERLPWTPVSNFLLPSFISIFDYTQYNCETHWDFLTEFLGFKFYPETLNFTESDCQHPLLMAHLRGLTAEIDGRSYIQGIKDYLELVNMLMKEKEFSKKLIKIIKNRYSDEERIHEMRVRAEEYSEDILGISKEQLECMIYSPFADQAKNLFKYLNNVNPSLLKKIGIEEGKVKFALINENCELIEFLESCSGLKKDQIVKLYKSDLLSRDKGVSNKGKCRKCFFGKLLEKDPHKMEINYLSKSNSKVAEMIYGR